MLSLERQRQLLAHLRVTGSGNVTDLAEVLGVSASTVRRELRDLGDRGLVRRVHGGASLIEGHVEAYRGARQSLHSAEKRRIGRAAAARVTDGSTVLITGGTTTEAMLAFLGDRVNLTVLTNGLNVALQLASHLRISVVVLGGVLRHQEMSLLGPLAESSLSEFHVDGVFCGAFGINAHRGIFGADVREAETDRRLLAAAEPLTVLADSSKFSQRGPARLASVEQLDCVITDDAAPAAAIEALRMRGVEVVPC